MLSLHEQPGYEPIAYSEDLDDDFVYLSSPHHKYELDDMTIDQINKQLNKFKINDEDQRQEIIDNFLKEREDSGHLKEIKMPHGSKSLIPVPSPKRECLYISGPSGVGKSTFAANYIKSWKKIFPNKKVYVFSMVNDDPALNIIKPIRIKIDEELIDDPLEANEFKDSLVLFDDIDMISDKKLLKAVKDIQKKILEIGRHGNTYILSTSHMTCDGHTTRSLLNECSKVVLFKGTNVKQLDYFLNNYMGVKLEKDKRDIRNLPSKWYMLHKNFPQYVLYERGCKIIG